MLTSEGVLFRSSKWILFFMSMAAAAGGRRSAVPGSAGVVLTPLQDPPPSSPRGRYREVSAGSSSSARNPEPSAAANTNLITAEAGAPGGSGLSDVSLLQSPPGSAGF